MFSYTLYFHKNDEFGVSYIQADKSFGYFSSFFFGHTNFDNQYLFNNKVLRADNH